MSMFKKYSKDATDKTHGEVDASIVDVVLPLEPLNQTGNIVRAGVHIAGAWLARGKKETGSFSL